VNNGTRKGGQPDVMNVMFSAPGLEDLWQLHFSALSGQEFSAPGLFIANRTDKPHSYTETSCSSRDSLNSVKHRCLLIAEELKANLLEQGWFEAPKTSAMRSLGGTQQVLPHFGATCGPGGSTFGPP
jgi:hypothetical protein